MIFLPIFAIALLFSILGNIQIIDIPDPLIASLVGVALFAIAQFLKRKIVGGDGQGNLYFQRKKLG
jgi:hypothetical protein